MSKDYHHLAKFQRCQIETLLQSCDSKAVIANTINMNESTIRREIKKIQI